MAHSGGDPFTELASSQQQQQQQQQQQASSHEEYLRRHGLDVYLRDSWRLVLVSRVSTEPPRLTLAKYFQSVVDGTNVVGREYAYIASTRRNRLAFLRHLHRAFWDTYRDQHVCLEDFLFLARRVCRDFPVGLLSDISQIARLEYAAVQPRPANSASAPASSSSSEAAAEGNASSQDESESRGTYAFSALLRTLSLYMLHPDLVDALLKHDGPSQTLLQRGFGSASGAQQVHQGGDGCDRGEDSSEQHFRWLVRRRLQRFATQRSDIFSSTSTSAPDAAAAAAAAHHSSAGTSTSTATTPTVTATARAQPQSTSSGCLLLAHFVGSELFENHLFEEIAAPPHEQALCASRPGIGSYANDFGLGATKTNVTNTAVQSDARPLTTTTTTTTTTTATSSSSSSSNGAAKPVHSRLTRGKPNDS